MKCYYKEDDLYAATYNFKDDIVGSFPSGWTDNDGANCATTIIATKDGHKNVLQLYDNSATLTARADLSFTQGLDTEIEFWFTKSSIAANTRVFLLICEGATELINLRFKEDDLYYYPPGGPYEVIKADFLVANTLFHFKIVLNDTTNTFDCYINGILEGDDLVYRNNSTSGADNLIFQTHGTDTGYYGYVDAIGISVDTNYTIGDNKSTDWHYYTQTQITGIDEYPIVSPILDSFTQITITLRDFEGGLFATYEPLDFTPIKVEDDSDNIIFKGYLKRKQFTADSLILYCSSFGEKLQWTPFTKDYVLAEGKVADVPLDTTNINRIVRPNADGATLEWKRVPATGDWYNKIDDTERNPRAPALTTYIYADNDDALESILIRFETFTGVTANSIDEVVVWFYAEDNGGAPPDLSVDVDCGGLVGSQTIALSNTPSWHSLTFTPINKSQADLDGLEVKFTAGDLGANDEQIIYACYCVVEYDGTYDEGLDLTDNDDVAFTWTAEQWIRDQDVGLLITDNTDNLSSETWECTDADLSSIVTGGDYGYGDKDSLDAVNDYDYAYYYDEAAVPLDMIITPTIGGAGIADTNTLHNIEINYRFGVRFTPDNRKKEVWLEIEYNGTTWVPIKHFVKYGTMTGALYFEETHTIETSDTELAKYLTKTVNDYTSITNIRFRFASTPGYFAYAYIYIDQLTVTINYYPVDIVPLMEQITDNGVSWIGCSGKVWATSGVVIGDYFKIGQNTQQIIADISSKSGIAFNLQSTLTKYIARKYKGTLCYDGLKSICLLEGLHWWEDFINEQILISKEADFVDSTVDLSATVAPKYEDDWLYSDDCNHYRKVEILGQAEQGIYAFKEDLTSTSLMEKTIMDESISTKGDAQEVADAQFAELSVKRPSIRLTVDGTQTNLTVGKTVHITLEKPDGTDIVAQTLYPIRRTDRRKHGKTGIKTVIYAGLGESPFEEDLAKTIRMIAYMATKAHTDRLIQ